MWKVRFIQVVRYVTERTNNNYGGTFIKDFLLVVFSVQLCSDHYVLSVVREVDRNDRSPGGHSIFVFHLQAFPDTTAVLQLLQLSPIVVVQFCYCCNAILCGSLLTAVKSRVLETVFVNGG